MKKKWIKTGIVFLGAWCWFLALLFYGETEKKAGCFNAYYDTPVLTRSALSAFTEQAEQKEPGEQADVLPQTTGWSMEEMQSVSSEVREVVTADVWKIAGSMESFFAGQLAGGSYPWEDDVQGCMVSTALAEKLFGTKNVQGNRITIAGMEYYIRGCVKNGSIFAAVRAEEEEGLNGIFLEYGEKSKPASSAQSLLMQMTGKEANGFFEGNLYSALARAIVSLPLWIFCIHKKRISPVEPDLRIRHPVLCKNTGRRGNLRDDGSRACVGISVQRRLSARNVVGYGILSTAHCRKTGNVQRTSALLVVPGRCGILF